MIRAIRGQKSMVLTKASIDNSHHSAAILVMLAVILSKQNQALPKKNG